MKPLIYIFSYLIIAHYSPTIYPQVGKDSLCKDIKSYGKSLFEVTKEGWKIMNEDPNTTAERIINDEEYKKNLDEKVNNLIENSDKIENRLRTNKNQNNKTNELNENYNYDQKWFVILGSFNSKDYENVEKRAEYVNSLGYNAQILNTDNYSNLRGGLLIVALGPYGIDTAKSLRENLKRFITDAYVKAGW